MDSPNRQGASRTMGGTFCGNAHGNAPKAADLHSHGYFDNVGPVKGRVMLYLSSADPAVLSPAKMTPSAVVKLDINDQTLSSVVGQVSARWSPIERKCYGFQI